MADIEYSWLYPKLGDLAEANSAFLQYLILSLGREEQEALETMTTMSSEDLEQVVAKVADLSKLRKRIDTLLQEIQINYSVRDILNRTPSLVEGTYEIAELIEAKYGEEPMWVFSTYGNLQIFQTIYSRSGMAHFILRILETNFDKLQLPRFQFQLLVQKAYQHNEDPRPCIFFLKWFQHYRRQIMDMLVERRRSYFRHRAILSGIVFAFRGLERFFLRVEGCSLLRASFLGVFPEELWSKGGFFREVWSEKAEWGLGRASLCGFMERQEGSSRFFSPCYVLPRRNTAWRS